MRSIEEYQVGKISELTIVNEDTLPDAKVVYKRRRSTDTEFLYAFLHFLVLKVCMTALMLLLNNAYVPDPRLTHPIECGAFENSCVYNHSYCFYGETQVMLPTNLVEDNNNSSSKYTIVGECRVPCKDGFMYMGFKKLCLENSFQPQFLLNCSETSDIRNEGPAWNSFTLSVVQVAVDNRIYLAQILGAVFIIATLWGLLLRYFPKATLYLTIIGESIGALLTATFLYLQTGRFVIVQTIAIGILGLMVLLFLVRKYIFTTIQYLESVEICLEELPSVFLVAFFMQGVSLAYGAGYVYVVRQSFFILFPVLSEEGCYLRPPYLLLMAWVVSGLFYMWTVMFLRQLTRGIVSGATAMYYFHSDDYSVRLSSSETLWAVKVAITKSSGSYFLMALLLPVVQFIRNFEGREGKHIISRLIACGAGKPLAELVRTLDSYAISVHAISGKDILNSAAASHGLLEEQNMLNYGSLGNTTRVIFQVIAAVAGTSVGIVVFVYLLYQYDVFEYITSNDFDIFRMSGFGFASILFLVLSAYFPKAALLSIAMDSVIRYGQNFGPIAMFTVSLVAAALTSLITDYMSDPILQSLETLVVCRALEKNADDIEQAMYGKKVEYSSDEDSDYGIRKPNPTRGTKRPVLYPAALIAQDENDSIFSRICGSQSLQNNAADHKMKNHERQLKLQRIAAQRRKALEENTKNTPTFVRFPKALQTQTGNDIESDSESEYESDSDE